MNEFTKGNVKNEIISILKYHSDNEACMKLSTLLLERLVSNKEIVLSKAEINSLLFDFDNNEINHTIFYIFQRLGVNLSEICFDGKIIKGLDFSGFNGIKINIDSVPNKDLTKVNFKNVILTGSLDNSILDYTGFEGYIGNLSLNPQNVIKKSIKGCSLSGILITGSFDDVDINCVNFEGAKGDIIINPQRVPNKDFICINFDNVLFVGDINEDGTYNKPSFKDLKIIDCKFKNLKEKIVININELSDLITKLISCDLTDVIVEGNVTSKYPPKNSISEDGTVLFETFDDDLYASYYIDENGNHIRIYLYQSMMWDKENECWVYIPRENETNLRMNVSFPIEEKILKNEKPHILSFFKRNK